MSQVPATSAAITAYPSIAELANGGMSCGAVTSSARTRPRASRSVADWTGKGPTASRTAAWASSSGLTWPSDSRSIQYALDVVLVPPDHECSRERCPQDRPTALAGDQEDGNVESHGSERGDRCGLRRQDYRQASHSYSEPQTGASQIAPPIAVATPLPPRKRCQIGKRMTNGRQEAPQQSRQTPRQATNRCRPPPDPSGRRRAARGPQPSCRAS